MHAGPSASRAPSPKPWPSPVKPLQRFVYVSSIAAGGPASSLAEKRESELATPVSAYGESKLAGEAALLQFKDRYPISIVRPPIVYGPRDKNVFVIIRTVSRRLAPMIPGATETGHKYYSVVHSDDLCQGINRAALVDPSKATSGEIFYVAGDGVHTYADLLDSMAEALGIRPLKLKIPRSGARALATGLSALGYVLRRTFPFNLDKLNEVLPDYWICSNEKAKQVLGFQPQYDLKRGMSHAIDWYKSQKWL